LAAGNNRRLDVLRWLAPLTPFGRSRTSLRKQRRTTSSYCHENSERRERPMWKPEHRAAADRSGLRYPSDLTDAEWVLVEPMIPPGRHGGGRGSVSGRGGGYGVFVRPCAGGLW